MRRAPWRGREVVVAAGTSRVLRLTGRLRRRDRDAPGCPELVVAPGDAVRLTGGVERWQGQRRRSGLVEWRVRVAAHRAAAPGRRRLELWAYDPERRLCSGTIGVDVRFVPGYELVRAEAGRLVVRNRTGAPWRRDEVWLAPPGALAPRVAMAQARVAPGEVATFTVPPELGTQALDLVHHRMARYLPAPLR